MAKIYFDILNHKLGEARNAVTEFAAVLALNDQQAKIAKASDARAKLQLLQDVLAPNHHPSWLKELGQCLNSFVASGESTSTSIAIVSVLSSLMDKMNAQKWSELTEENKSLQISSVADEAYKKSKLPKLFENLAEELEKLITSEAIDSAKAITRLQELIKLIRMNARSSWYSAQYLVPFAFSVIKHTITAYVKEWSGPIGDGITSAIEEMAQEWPTTQQAVNEAVHDALESSFPDVPYLPSASDIDAVEVTQVFETELRRIEDKRDQQTQV